MSCVIDQSDYSANTAGNIFILKLTNGVQSIHSCSKIFNQKHLTLFFNSLSLEIKQAWHLHFLV